MLKLLSKGKAYVIIFLYVNACHLGAMEEPPEIINDYIGQSSSAIDNYHRKISCYKGQQMTLENLKQFSEEDLAIPAPIKQPLSQWTHNNKDLLHTLCILKSATTWEEQYRYIIDPQYDYCTGHCTLGELGFLKKQGHLSKSTNSYVFPISLDNEEYYVKIASAATRLMNLATQARIKHNNFPKGPTQGRESYREEELELLDAPTTFQTISRISNVLQVNKICAEESLSTVSGIESHLVPVPERPDKKTVTGCAPLEDNNYFVLQKYVPGLKQLGNHDVSQFSKKMIEELFLLVKYTTAMHDIEYNLHGIIDKEIVKIAFCDLEQSFKTAPDFFLSDNPTLIDLAVAKGLHGLHGHLKSASYLAHRGVFEPLLHLKALVANDRDLETSRFRANLVRIFGLKR